MRITLIASDESTAPLYRVRMLARVLMMRHEVEVLGFHFKSEELDPLAPRDFPYRAYPAHTLPRFLADARALANAVRGDVIYAMKPRPTSFGLAMWLGRLRRSPVVVDVDDWEPFMVRPYSRHATKNGLYALARLHDPNNWLATMAMEPLISRAAAVTTVSHHLRARYGGVIVPQYVDASRFDPTTQPRGELRRQLGLDRYLLAVFAGIAQPNKGVGDILDAFQRIGRNDWRLVIVGPRTPYACDLARRDPRVVLLGTQPPESTPAFLAMADLVVLPQRREPASAGQMPMKLFEAMAMARPIVATHLADIPRLLDGCGWVVPPGDPDALAGAIAEVLARPELAKSRGEAARRRVLARYTYEQGAERLAALMQEVGAPHGGALAGGAAC